MGYKHDQTYFPETFRPDPSSSDQIQTPSQSQSQSRGPPALPPRLDPASSSPYLQPPPSYAEAAPTYHSQPLSASWSSQDPRSSSTQSLVPAESLGEKRTLLLIYIHGFLGTETTFQSFPAHVHNLVTVILADTHVVHTKIYPRYKSKNAIEYARDDFSKWLCPHESANTDIILIGHSMGGILASEVALLVPYSRTSTNVLRHRIIGTINFDCPFLGMHPGVVVSGIGSLFRPAPEFSSPRPSNMKTGESELRPMPAGDEASTFASSNTDLTRDTSATPSSASIPQAVLSPAVSCGDPNFNPRFNNDMPTPVRKGWESAIHFMTKHSDGLTTAAKSYVTSHLEFGGCLADYKGLKNRYSRLRALADTDPHQGNHATRVRFVNYYTASSGRPKKTKLPPPGERAAQVSQRLDSEERVERGLQDMSLSNHGSRSLPRSSSVSVDEPQDDEKVLKAPQDSDGCTSAAGDGCSPGDITMPGIAPEMVLLDAAPIVDSESDDNTMKTINSKSNDNSQLTSDIVCSTATTVSAPSKAESQGPSQTEPDFFLPPLPPSPQQPPAFSPSSYADKDARNLAQKEYSRQNKAYMQALKDHGKALRDREKLTEKRAKAARKASEKESKLREKEHLRAQREAVGLTSSPAPAASKSAMSCRGRDSQDGSGSGGERSAEANKAMRDKKFCMLPPKIDGQIDPCWVRVFMRDVDEVGAHCGLFFVGEQYEWLVGDVGNRIQAWIRES